MSKDIFNKSMLEKLSSPDQIDRAVKITSLPTWLFACGGVFILLVAFIWSVTASLKITTPAQAVFMPSDSSYSVVSKQTGIVKEVFVASGDSVNKGDKICELDTTDIDEKLKKIDEKKSEINAITLSSSNDVVTEDTRELENIKIQISQANIEPGQLSVMIAGKESNYNSENSKLSSLKSNLEASEKLYLEKQADPDTNPEELLILKQEIEKLSSDVSLQTQKVASLKSDLDSSKNQLDASNYSSSRKQMDLIKQFNITKKSLLNQVEKSQTDTSKLKSDYVIKATKKGTISELSVMVGGVVQKGQSVYKARKNNKNEYVMHCYMPISEAKKVKKNMEVLITPTTVDEEEYGHMVGKVYQINKNASAVAELSEDFGNDVLTKAFASQGPQIAFKCKLKKDSSTDSGYYWSSKNGSKVTVDEGSIATCKVVTEDKKPIDMLIPYIKNKIKEWTSSEENTKQNK